MNNIKILIVDDHPMMRDALRTSLSVEEDLKVIGEASNGLEALKLLETLEPDLIMMDILMPEMTGIEAIERIIERNPQARILVLTSMEEEDRVISAIQAGALGYFPKTAPRQYLLEAIHRVADGAPYMPTGITLKLFQGLKRIKTVPKDNPEITITLRQREILVLLAEGNSDEEISAILHLQESTVRAHIHNVQNRLGLETRAQVIAYAHKFLINPPGE